MNLSSSPQCPRCCRQARSRRPDRRRQIRLDVSVAGAAHTGAGGACHHRYRPRPRPRGVPHRGLGRGPDRSDCLHRRRRARHRRRRNGRDRGSHRQPRGRHPARPRGDRRRQAYRHGQCRGRRAGGPAAGGGSAQGRRGLFAGLWRPAGTDIRDGRLGPGDRLSRRRRRQGHKIPAGLSRRNTGRCLGPLRVNRRRSAIGRDEPANVQLVSRRHQIRHRDGGDRQRHRAGCSNRRPAVSALRRRRSAACDAAERPGRRTRKIRRGRSGLLAGARRPAGVSGSALGCVRGAGSAERLRRGLFQAIRPEDRCYRAVLLRCTSRII